MLHNNTTQCSGCDRLYTMSLEKAKGILWHYANNYTDEEIMKIVDYLTAIANIVLENHYKERGY